VEIEKSILIP